MVDIHERKKKTVIVEYVCIQNQGTDVDEISMLKSETELGE